MGRKGEIALLIQRKAPSPGIFCAVLRLNGKKTLSLDRKIQIEPRLLRSPLGKVYVKLTGCQDIALFSNFLCTAFVLVAYAADQHFLKGAVRVLFRLIAWGGQIYHVIGDHIQPPALGEHAGGQIVKAFCHVTAPPFHLLRFHVLLHVLPQMLDCPAVDL